MSSNPVDPLGAAVERLRGEEIAEIRAREKAATPADTLTVFRYDHGGGRVIVDDPHPRELVADFYSEADREFYVHARTDIPKLLEAVTRLTEERDALRVAVTYLQEMPADNGFAPAHIGGCQYPYGGKCSCGMKAWAEQFHHLLSLARPS